MTHRKKVAVRKRLRRRRALFREFGQETVEFVEEMLMEGLKAELDKALLYGEGSEPVGISEMRGITMFTD